MNTTRRNGQALKAKETLKAYITRRVLLKLDRELPLLIRGRAEIALSALLLGR